MPEPARPAGPLAPLVGLGRDLRGRGLPVGTGRILTFCRSVAALGAADRDSLYWAGRLSLVARRDDLEAFDGAFEAWFRSLRRDGEAIVEVELPPGLDIEVELASLTDAGIAVGGTVVSWRPANDGSGTEPAGDGGARIAASAIEVLRTKSFAELTEDERRRVARLIRDLTVWVPLERTRRTRASANGRVFDARRTFRRSLRTQGEPFERAWRARRSRSRPLVLVLDVSGSMAPYARALLQFAFAAMASGRRVEVFCFGTRLTRVTRALRTKDPDRAFADLSRSVADWEGGTRIGDSMKALLDGWGQRSALRGAVVVVCSDGLERGDPDVLRAQMARLRRLAFRVVWANPLKGSPRYEPLARGMAAALPSVDVFLSGHNLESLEVLAEAVGR